MRKMDVDYYKRGKNKHRSMTNLDRTTIRNDQTRDFCQTRPHGMAVLVICF